MLTTLRVYQDRVAVLADEAEGLLLRDGKAALPRIAKLRIDQGVAMAAYQLFVHREIFEPLVKAGSPAQIEAAKQIKVECVAFSGTFCQYIQLWSKRDAVAEWNDYHPAALAMIAAIRAHIARVQHEIAPMLGRFGEAGAARVGGGVQRYFPGTSGGLQPAP